MLSIQFELFNHSFLFAMVLAFAASARIAARLGSMRANVELKPG